MRRILFLVFGAILCHSVFPQTVPASLLDVNYEKLVGRADLVYNKPVTRSEEGLPVGNGVMGSLVWTTSAALHLQLNRTDVFANNSSSNNFFERHTDYCGGLGFIDIDLINGIEDLFAANDFEQKLSCYDGLVTVKGKGIAASVLTWNEQDVMAIKVEDNRAIPYPIQTSLRPLRTPVSKKGDHQAISTVKVIDNKIILTQQFKEGSFYCGSAIVIEVSGRKSKAEVESDALVRISSAAGTSGMEIFMASAASFDPSEDLIAAATKKLEAAKSKGFDELLKSNRLWWKDFWKRSFIHLSSDQGEADFIEKHYTYYLYVMASSSRGRYPAKFNGMIWSTGGDERKWGNLFWGANQSCLYNALFQTNHMELLDPMFNMYSSNFNAFEKAASQQWDSKGIFIPETVAFDGLAPIPDDIAGEMRDLYLVRKPWSAHSEAFTNYAYTKMPFLSRWNWKKDEGWKDGRWYTGNKGGGAFGHVTHIFSRGAKIAYQYWLKYEYTQDVNWLRKDAYPMLKGVAEFYRNFPNVKKEKDGKYHIYHVNDNESVWGGHNTVEEISSMMGIFPAAIKASEVLGVDADLRSAWKEFIENLSALPLSSDYTTKDGDKPVSWIRSLPPMIQGPGEKIPDPNTMPVWFFDLCNLEADKKTLAIANTTYSGYFTSGLDANTKIYVLSKLASAGAILGRTEATRYLIPNQLQTAEVPVMPNRMDMREGAQTTSVQRLGRAAEALQLALCQSVPSGPGKDPVIRIFPAWPAEWDAQFTLLCRGAFLVTASMKKGAIQFVEIESQGGNACHIRNPWADKEVVIYRNGKKIKESKDDLITIPTSKNDRLMIFRKGDKPDQFRQKIL